jgi:hypothetical protein
MPIGPQRAGHLCATPPSELEELEGLEQLRFLAAGIPVDVVEVETPPLPCASSTIPRTSRRSKPRSPWRASNESFFSGTVDLDPKYSVILCDIWGVVHDGVQLYPNAAERLRQWRGPGAQGHPHHQRAAHRRCG